MGKGLHCACILVVGSSLLSHTTRLICHIAESTTFGACWADQSLHVTFFCFRGSCRLWGCHASSLHTANITSSMCKIAMNMLLTDTDFHGINGLSARQLSDFALMLQVLQTFCTEQTLAFLITSAMLGINPEQRRVI